MTEQQQPSENSGGVPGILVIGFIVFFVVGFVALIFLVAVPQARKKTDITTLAEYPGLTNPELIAEKLNTSGCLSCHAPDIKIIGPTWEEISKRYEADPRRVNEVAINILNGGQGKWGEIPMPKQVQLTPEEAQDFAAYILQTYPKEQ